LSELAELTRELKQQQNRAHEFARMIQNLAVSKGDLMMASALAKSRRDLRVAAALDGMMRGSAPLGDMIMRGAVTPGTTADTSWAGPLAPLIPLANQFIEYLYPMTIVGGLDGLTSVPFQCKFARTVAGVGLFPT
jgi:hypothetical protein